MGQASNFKWREMEKHEDPHSFHRGFLLASGHVLANVRHVLKGFGLPQTHLPNSSCPAWGVPIADPLVDIRKLSLGFMLCPPLVRWFSIKIYGHCWKECRGCCLGGLLKEGYFCHFSCSMLAGVVAAGRIGACVSMF